MFSTEYIPIWGGIFISVYFIVQLYNKFTTGVYKGRVRLDGKTVVVTGASAGIGLYCAEDFARRGAKVIMVCRDMKKAEARKMKIIESTGNENIKLKHIDFTSFASVRKCASEILREESRIDVLLNNAGAGGNGAVLTEDGVDNIMQSNYFGPFLFTNILLGKIIGSAPSRIVNVSSVAYKVAKLDLNHLKVPNTKNEIMIYSISKLGNIYFTNELAKRLEASNVKGVTVNSLHPGVFYSEIGRQAGILYNTFGKVLVKLFFKTIEEAAQTSIYLCVAPEVHKITGKYFTDCKVCDLKANAKDEGVSKKLWELTERIVGLQSHEKHY